MKTVKLDNNIYDDNKVFNKEGDVIFKGNFKEITKFVFDRFHITLPTGLTIEEYENFNGRDFKVELGINIPEETINFFKSLEEKSTELYNIYNKLFGNLKIKEILNLIKTKEILNYKNEYTKFNFDDEDLINEIKYQLFYKYKEDGIKVTFYPELEVKEDSFIFTTDLFFIEEDENIFIFEMIQGQGTLHYIYNISDNEDFSIETWKTIIEYSKDLDNLNKKYSNLIGANNESNQ